MYIIIIFFGSSSFSNTVYSRHRRQNTCTTVLMYNIYINVCMYVYMYGSVIYKIYKCTENPYV